MAPRSDGVGSGVPATDWPCARGGRTDAAKVPRNARRFTSGLRDNGATTLAAHEVDGNRRWRVDASTAARSQLHGRARAPRCPPAGGALFACGGVACAFGVLPGSSGLPRWDASNFVLS